MDLGGAAGLSHGGVAAIVIVLLLTIAITVTVIVILALLAKKRNREEKNNKGFPIGEGMIITNAAGAVHYIEVLLCGYYTCTVYFKLWVYPLWHKDIGPNTLQM